MKKLNFILSAILLIFAGSFVSCNNKEEVNYDLYPCECKKEWIGQQPFTKGEVFLFKDYIPSEFLYMENTESWGYIMYRSESNTALLFFPGACPGTFGPVCNFSDFANEWLNYENGTKVYIEGVMYHCSFPRYAIGFPFCFVLTRVERRQL